MNDRLSNCLLKWQLHNICSPGKHDGDMAVKSACKEKLCVISPIQRKAMQSGNERCKMLCSYSAICLEGR